MSGMMMGAAWQLSGIPWLFDFNSKLTALPTALRRMNATYTRNSVKNVVQDGALVQLAANQFGTSYDDVTGLYGYVPEPAATNLALYSEELNRDGGANPWAHVGATVPANSVAAPDGTMTAEKITEDSATSTHRVYQNFTFSAVTYTLSAFIKAAGRNFAGLRTPAGTTTKFNLSTGAVASLGHTSASVVPLANGWYRCSVTWTASAGASAFGIDAYQSASVSNYLGDGTSGIYVWGAQLETGSRATSYIATTGSTATRAADVLSVPLANIPGFSSAAYTLFGEYRDDYIGGADTQHTLVQVDANAATNYANLYTLDNAGTPVALVRSGAATQSVQVGANSTTVRWRSAVSCQLNSIKAAFKGVAATEDTSATMPVTPTTLHIGCNESGAAQFNGRIFRAGIIPQALTQAQINGLTTL